MWGPLSCVRHVVDFAVRCWLCCALLASLCTGGFAVRCWLRSALLAICYVFPGFSRKFQENIFRDFPEKKSPGIFREIFSGICPGKKISGIFRGQIFRDFSVRNIFSRAGPARAGPGRPEPGRDGTARAIRDISLTNVGMAPFPKVHAWGFKNVFGEGIPRSHFL